MNRIWKGLIVIAFIFLISAVAEAQWTGNDLVQGWKASQLGEKATQTADVAYQGSYIGYIMGVCQATNYYHNIASSFTVGQACNVVGKYLDEHPERLHEAAITLVMDALSQAFPQFPTKKK